jgi:hypothetical protein
MEISDIPTAVWKALRSGICLERMTVSRAIDVRMPFTIASSMIAITGQPISVN